MSTRHNTLTLKTSQCGGEASGRLWKKGMSVMVNSRTLGTSRMVFLSLAAVSAIVFSMLVSSGSALAAAVEPVFVDGNPTCVGLGYQFGFKVDPPNSGTYPVAGVGSITVTADGTTASFTSDFGIDAVIVKGGSNAHVYAYNPETFGDSGLQAPNNASGGPAGLSHFEFCYDIENTPTPEI